MLAQSKEASLCHGGIFCDRPPTNTLSAFSFYDFHGPGHAFFVEVDHEDWSRTRIVSVDLEDGESVELQEDIPLAHQDRGRPGWVYGMTRWGKRIYVALLVDEGMALYMTPEPGEPLMHVYSMDIDEDRYPIGGWLGVNSRGVMWGVQTSVVGDLHWVYDTVFIDHDGGVLFSPDNIPVDGTLCGEAALGGNHMVVAVSMPEDPDVCQTLVFDTATLEHRILDSEGDETYLLRFMPLSPDGRFAVERNRDDSDEYFVYDVATGGRIFSFHGDPMTFDPAGDRLVYNVYVQDLGSMEVRMVSLPGGEETLLADGTEEGHGFISFNKPRALFASGGAVILPTGTSGLMGWENVGIRMVIPDTGEYYDLEPPAFSEVFYRAMNLSQDGKMLFYLDPVDDRLTLTAVDLDTLERMHPLQNFQSHVRGFRLGTDPLVEYQ